MKNSIFYLLLLVVIISNGAAGLVLKFASKKVVFESGTPLTKTLTSMIFNPRLILGIVLYGFSFFVSTLVYTKLSLGLAYPIIMVGTLIIITIVSALFLHEQISSVQIIAILILISGIILLASKIK